MPNDWGDVELDATAMRALAHPVRLAILDRLREDGPDTATGLSPRVGASPSVTSWHLRHLAEHGLVEDAPSDGRGRKRWWQAVGHGFRSGDVDDRDAHRVLGAAMDVADAGVVTAWRRDVQPVLEPEWAAVAGHWNTRITVTTEELREIDAAIEALLTPFVQRGHSAQAAPAGARKVRILRYTMPQAAPS
jgi:DNA-binding transcriptional ArsR family regulator